ncbi:hypothetical protein HRbin40_00389 [bacterium HR40]|nr:hypothetical protein HRbin40_00389 [bacterium HR40]
MRRSLGLLGCAVLAFGLAGSPAGLALDEAQRAALQEAAARGDTALRAAVIALVAGELRAGRAMAVTAQELIAALMGGTSDPEVLARHAVLAAVGAAEAVGTVPGAGVTAAQAAQAFLAAALELGSRFPAFLESLVQAVAVEAASGTSPHAVGLPAALAGALETPGLDPETRNIVASAAQQQGILASPDPTDSGSAGNQDGGSAGGGGASFGTDVFGNLGGIPAAVSPDRPGDVPASPS